MYGERVKESEQRKEEKDRERQGECGTLIKLSKPSSHPHGALTERSGVYWLCQGPLPKPILS